MRVHLDKNRSVGNRSTRDVSDLSLALQELAASAAAVLADAHESECHTCMQQHSAVQRHVQSSMGINFE